MVVLSFQVTPPQYSPRVCAATFQCGIAQPSFETRYNHSFFDKAFINLFARKIVVTNATLPQNSDSSSSSPQQTNLPQNQKPNKLRRRPPQPSIMQIERALGAGSFRDGEPDIKTEEDSDVKKITMDLLLGQALEGRVQKMLRETGEWLSENGETRFRSTKTRKGILVFAFQWMMPIWVLSFLIASGAIKLPFSIPFLDDLLM